MAPPDVTLPFDFPEPLRTERLTLRCHAERDIDDIHSYRSREDVSRYLLNQPHTPEETAAKVRKYMQARTLAGPDDYWQTVIELDGRVIGDVYFSIKLVGEATAEIGWTIHPDFGGHGYMTEAAGAIIDLAFRRMNFHRVFANLDARNAASAKLCERLGMRREAHYLEDCWSKDEWTDSFIYGILAREWQS